MKSFSRELANLDFLRSVAVLCVLLEHLWRILLGRVPLPFGRLGVYMFFVHTSLVLMMSLEREELEGPKLFINFYIRRFFRIYPLSIACVLIIFATHFHYTPAGGLVYRLFTKRELFANVLLIQNVMALPNLLQPLWTLPLEVQMYIFLPALFLLARTSRLRTMYFIWGCAVLLAAIQPHVSERLNLLAFVPCFLPGIIAWMIGSRVRPRLPGSLWPLTVVTLGLIFVFFMAHRMYVGWAFCLLLGLAIPQFSEIRFGWLKVASKTIAKYSYGIYLTHVFAFALGLGVFREPITQWSIVLALLFLLPLAAYHLIEHPGILLGKRIADRICGSTRKEPKSRRDGEPVAASNSGLVGDLQPAIVLETSEPESPVS